MTDNLPAYDLWNGHACALDIHEPCWLRAGRMTNIDTGQSWRFTYRSAGLRSGDPMYDRMIDWLDGALPLGEPETVIDPDMMFGQAELTEYELRSLDVTA